MSHPQNTRRPLRHAMLALALLCVQLSAQAQIDKINKNLEYGKDALIGACVVIMTGLLAHAGIEIASRHKRVMDVWHILVGAGIVGAAATAAAFLIN